MLSPDSQSSAAFSPNDPGIDPPPVASRMHADEAPPKKPPKRLPPPKDFRTLLPDAPETDFSFVRICDVDALTEHVEAWRRLAETALEPNTFFEAAMLIPALRHLAGDDRPECVLVFARCKTNHDGPPILCGLFPIVRRARYRKRKLLGASTWLHLHCYSGTPLVRRDVAAEVLHAFFDWLATEQRIKAFYFPLIHGGGRFGQTLVNVLQQRSAFSFVRSQIARAMFTPSKHADEFFQQVWSRKLRHETKRKQRRLEDLGSVQIRNLTPEEDVAPWLDAFLELEASGWKGGNGTAMACVPAQRQFCVEGLTSLHASGQLGMSSLDIDGRPIAMNTNFFSGDGAYCFKIAYDESLSKHSPGVVLAAELIRLLHQRPNLRWADSCAAANHPMIEQLWDRRRLMQSIWISTGGFMGDLFVSHLSFLSSLEQCGVKWFKPLYRKWIKRS